MGIHIEASQLPSCVRNTVSCVLILEPQRVTWEKSVGWDYFCGNWVELSEGTDIYAQQPAEPRYFCIKRGCQGNLRSFVEVFLNKIGEVEAFHSLGYKEAQHCHYTKK